MSRNAHTVAGFGLINPARGVVVWAPGAESRRGARNRLCLVHRRRSVDARGYRPLLHHPICVYSCYAAGIWSDERGTNLGDGGSPFYGVYQTSDAKFMAVGALEPQFYAEFLRLLELPSDPAAQLDRHAWPQLRTKISDAFAARPQQEWAKIFSDSDACVAPVLGMADAPGHPQLAARKTLFVGNGITQPSPAPRFSCK
ncbi:MAG: CoA transferase [Mycobacterium sp.]